MLLYYRQSKCVQYLLYMKVLVVQLDGHHASQTHPSDCQQLSLCGDLQTTVQIAGRQQVLLNPLSNVHKGLWISIFICKNRMFWFTFMICFTFSICINSSGPPGFITKERLLVHWPFSSDEKTVPWDVTPADRIDLASLPTFFFLKDPSADVKRWPRIMWQKLSNAHYQCHEDFYFTKLKCCFIM